MEKKKKKILMKIVPELLLSTSSKVDTTCPTFRIILSHPSSQLVSLSLSFSPSRLPYFFAHASRLNLLFHSGFSPAETGCLMPLKPSLQRIRRPLRVAQMFLPVQPPIMSKPTFFFEIREQMELITIMWARESSTFGEEMERTGQDRTGGDDQLEKGSLSSSIFFFLPG